MWGKAGSIGNLALYHIGLYRWWSIKCSSRAKVLYVPFFGQPAWLTQLHSIPFDTSGYFLKVAPCKTCCNSPIGRWPGHGGSPCPGRGITGAQGRVGRRLFLPWLPFALWAGAMGPRGPLSYPLGLCVIVQSYPGSEMTFGYRGAHTQPLHLISYFKQFLGRMKGVIYFLSYL